RLRLEGGVEQLEHLGDDLQDLGVDLLAGLGPVDHREALGFGRGQLQELLAHRFVELQARLLQTVQLSGVATLLQRLAGEIEQDGAVGSRPSTAHSDREAISWRSSSRPAPW